MNEELNSNPDVKGTEPSYESKEDVQDVPDPTLKLKEETLDIPASHLDEAVSEKSSVVNPEDLGFSNSDYLSNKDLIKLGHSTGQAPPIDVDVYNFNPPSTYVRPRRRRGRPCLRSYAQHFPVLSSEPSYSSVQEGGNSVSDGQEASVKQFKNTTDTTGSLSDYSQDGQVSGSGTSQPSDSLFDINKEEKSGMVGKGGERGKGDRKRVLEMMSFQFNSSDPPERGKSDFRRGRRTSRMGRPPKRKNFMAMVGSFEAEKSQSLLSPVTHSVKRVRKDTSEYGGSQLMRTLRHHGTEQRSGSEKDSGEESLGIPEGDQTFEGLAETSLSARRKMGRPRKTTSPHETDFSEAVSTKSGRGFRSFRRGRGRGRGRGRAGSLSPAVGRESPRSESSLDSSGSRQRRQSKHPLSSVEEYPSDGEMSTQRGRGRTRGAESLLGSSSSKRGGVRRSRGRPPMAHASLTARRSVTPVTSEVDDPPPEEVPTRRFGRPPKKPLDDLPTAHTPTSLVSADSPAGSVGEQSSKAAKKKKKKHFKGLKYSFGKKKKKPKMKSHGVQGLLDNSQETESLVSEDVDGDSLDSTSQDLSRRLLLLPGELDPYDPSAEFDDSQSEKSAPLSLQQQRRAYQRKGRAAAESEDLEMMHNPEDDQEADQEEGEEEEEEETGDWGMYSQENEEFEDDGLIQLMEDEEGVTQRDNEEEEVVQEEEDVNEEYENEVEANDDDENDETYEVEEEDQEEAAQDELYEEQYEDEETIQDDLNDDEYIQQEDMEEEDALQEYEGSYTEEQEQEYEEEEEGEEQEVAEEEEEEMEGQLDPPEEEEEEEEGDVEGHLDPAEEDGEEEPIEEEEVEEQEENEIEMENEEVVGNEEEEIENNDDELYNPDEDVENEEEVENELENVEEVENELENVEEIENELENVEEINDSEEFAADPDDEALMDAEEENGDAELQNIGNDQEDEEEEVPMETDMTGTEEPLDPHVMEEELAEEPVTVAVDIPVVDSNVSCGKEESDKPAGGDESVEDESKVSNRDENEEKSDVYQLSPSDHKENAGANECPMVNEGAAMECISSGATPEGSHVMSLKRPLDDNSGGPEALNGKGNNDSEDGVRKSKRLNRIGSSQPLAIAAPAFTAKTGVQTKQDELDMGMADASLRNVLCKCRVKENPRAVNVPGEMYCQAMDCFDGRIIGCCNTVSNFRYLRVSGKIPFMLLCSIHRQRIRRHNCCPGCGLFCTQGIFLECRWDKVGSRHYYHKLCGLVINGTPLCPHCGTDQVPMEVHLELKLSRKPIIYLKQHQEKKGFNCSARMSLSKTLMVETEPVVRAEEDTSIELANGKVITPAKLPVGLDREKLSAAIAAIKMGKAVNAKPSPKGIYWSCKQGDLEKLLFVLVNGVSANAKVREYGNQSGLHTASTHGCLGAIHILVSAGAALDFTDAQLHTPLMIAVIKSHNDIVNYLIQAGANLTVKTQDGMTCLHLAAKSGNFVACKYILDSGRLSRHSINIQDEGGWTPLVWASENRCINVVKILLDRGANPQICDVEQNTALHWAAFSGSTHICSMVLDRGCSLRSMNGIGDTPLHIAARQNHVEAVVLLLARGAPLEICNARNQTPLDCTFPDTDVFLQLTLNTKLRNVMEENGFVNERILSSDIAAGKESVPIPVMNGVDHEGLPKNYIYIAENCEAFNVNIDRTMSSLKWCDCEDGCNSDHCICSQLNFQCWYDPEGKLLPDFNYTDPPMIFECNRACGCSKLSCHNRVVQHGMTSHLQVFRTKGKGWGVRALKDIEKGSYVCEYVGEIITDLEADLREDDSYLFDLDNRDSETFCIDARQYGNVARFINHLCEANLTPVKIFIDHQDLVFPRIAFFANRDIEADEELGFDYGEKFWVIKYKHFTCMCGSDKCKYSSATIQTTLENYNKKIREHQQQEKFMENGSSSLSC